MGSVIRYSPSGRRVLAAYRILTGPASAQATASRMSAKQARLGRSPPIAWPVGGRQSPGSTREAHGAGGSSVAPWSQER